MKQEKNNWNKCSEKLPDRTIECILIYKVFGEIANWEKAKYNYEEKRFEYFDYGIGDWIPFSGIIQPYLWKEFSLDFFDDFFLKSPYIPIDFLLF